MVPSGCQLRELAGHSHNRCQRPAHTHSLAAGETRRAVAAATQPTTKCSSSSSSRTPAGGECSAAGMDRRGAGQPAYLRAVLGTHTVPSFLLTAPTARLGVHRGQPAQHHTPPPRHSNHAQRRAQTHSRTSTTTVHHARSSSFCAHAHRSLLEHVASQTHQLCSLRRASFWFFVQRDLQLIDRGARRPNPLCSQRSMRPTPPVTAAIPIPLSSSAPSSSSLLTSTYLVHASHSQPSAAQPSLGPASSLICSTSSSSTAGTPGSSPSISSASSSVVSTHTTPSYSSASASPASSSSHSSPARPRSHSSATAAPRRRLSSRYELCVHARLNCSCSCRSEVTKSHRWQHAYRARHTGCDCRWRELRESGRRKKRKAGKDEAETAQTEEEGGEGERAVGEAAGGDSPLVGTDAKDGSGPQQQQQQAQSDDGEDEEQIEEIAPFDERVRLFANAPRTPPAMSASFLAPSYAPLQLDTVRAHVVPADAAGFSTIYAVQQQQQHPHVYSAPVVHHHQHHQHHQQQQQQQQQQHASAQPAGAMYAGSGFSVSSSQPVMLPPSAQSGSRSNSGPPTAPYMSPLPNSLLSFSAAPSLQLQQTVSLPAGAHYGVLVQTSNQPMGQSATAAGSYPTAGLHLSSMQQQMASMQAAAMQHQHQHQQQQLVSVSNVLTQHSLSQYMPPGLHSLSSLPSTLSLPHALSAPATGSSTVQQQQSTSVYASPTHPTGGGPSQSYTTALPSHLLQSSSMASPAQYVHFTAGGPSATQLYSLPQMHTLTALPASPQQPPQS